MQEILILINIVAMWDDCFIRKVSLHLQRSVLTVLLCWSMLSKEGIENVRHKTTFGTFWVDGWAKWQFSILFWEQQPWLLTMPVYMGGAYLLTSQNLRYYAPYLRRRGYVHVSPRLSSPVAGMPVQQGEKLREWDICGARTINEKMVISMNVSQKAVTGGETLRSTEQVVVSRLRLKSGRPDKKNLVFNVWWITERRASPI